MFDGVLLIAKGLAAGAKLLDDWDGLHACWPKRDMLPNADPGELNPKDVWPNEDGWFAAAATDPNNPLDAGVVEGEPKIDDVVLVAVGVPKIDEVVVDAEPNIELDDAGTVWLPNIDELVVAGEPKTVVAWAGDPKLVVFVVVADPNKEDTVVVEGVPNIEEVVVFNEFPKIDADVVVAGVPKIEDDGVTLVDVPKMVDAVVFVGVPKIEEVVVAFVVVPKIEEVLVELGVLNIEGALELGGGLKIEDALFVFVGVLKIEGVLVAFVLELNMDVWLVVETLFPKMPEALVELIGVPIIEVLVDGISKIGAPLVLTGVVGGFSLSGVTGSDIIGVGLSESWDVTSVTQVVEVVVGTVLETVVVLTIPNVEETVGVLTGSLTTVVSVFDGNEKLNDAVTAVGSAEVKTDLVSGVVVFDALSLVAVKLNVDSDAVSDFELKLKLDNVASFAEIVSCLFFDKSPTPNPENTLGVSKGLDVSKLKLANGVSFGLSILFLIESAKLNVRLGFDAVVSVLTVDILAKLNGVFSFDSDVPEITSKVDFAEMILRLLLKFKGAVVDGFKLKSTGSLLAAIVDGILFPNNEVVLVELNITGSLVKLLVPNLFVKSFSVVGLGVEVLFTGFQIGVFAGKDLGSDENVVVSEETIIGVDTIPFFCCAVGLNKGCLNSSFVSATFCSLVLFFVFSSNGTCGNERFSFVITGVKWIEFSCTFCFDIGFKGVLHTGLPRSIFAYLDLVILVRLVLKSFNHSWSWWTLESESALWFADSTEYFLATLYELIADTPSLSKVIFNKSSESFDKPTSLRNIKYKIKLKKTWSKKLTNRDSFSLEEEFCTISGANDNFLNVLYFTSSTRLQRQLIFSFNLFTIFVFTTNDL